MEVRIGPILGALPEGLMFLMFEVTVDCESAVSSSLDALDRGWKALKCELVLEMVKSS